VLSEERFISLFFKYEEVKAYSLRNPLYFKEALVQIKNADSCDNYIKNLLNKSLKNIENLELTN
jgi:uncharacterized UPF0146 family protein